jgi:outer membrane protein assembly factor BamE (lipoprotein component of BamABCDE complex)
VFRSTLRSISLSASVALALPAAGLTACAPTIDQRGNLPEPTKLAQVHPGTTTREQVAQLLGTPSSTGVFDDKNWYYISRRTSQTSFLDPDVLDQQVYIVNFDDKGVVRGVDHKDLADGKEIEPAPGATPAPGRELTFFEQVLGNVGRFNKSSGTGDTTASAAARSTASPDWNDQKLGQ